MIKYFKRFGNLVRITFKQKRKVDKKSELAHEEWQRMYESGNMPDPFVAKISSRL